MPGISCITSLNSELPDIISPNPFFLVLIPTNLFKTVGLLKSPSINKTLFAFSSYKARLKEKVVFPSDGLEDVIRKLLFFSNLDSIIARDDLIDSAK